MAYKDYIPKNDVELSLWGQSVIAYVATKHTDSVVVRIVSETKATSSELANKN